MPFALPSIGELLTRANFGAPLKSFVDALETSVQALQVTSDAHAASLAAPVGLTGLSAEVQGLLVGVVTDEISGNYTLTSADAGRMKVATGGSGSALIVPAGLAGTTGSGRTYSVIQKGAGPVTIRSASTGGSVSVRDSAPYVNSTNTATAHNVLMPTVATGDGIVVVLGMTSGAGVWTPPSDFVFRGTIGPSGHQQSVFTKANAAAADSGATKTWALSGTLTPVAGLAVSLAGAHLSDFVDGLVPAAGDVEDDDSADPHVTLADNVLELSIWTGSSATPVAIPAVPSGMIAVGAGAATNSAAANDMAVHVARAASSVAAGTTIGNRTWSAAYGATRTLGVKPAAAEAVTLISGGGVFTTAGPGSVADILVTPSGIFVTGRLVA